MVADITRLRTQSRYSLPLLCQFNLTHHMGVIAPEAGLHKSSAEAESAAHKGHNRPNSGKVEISADDFFAVCDANLKLGYMETDTSTASASYSLCATHCYQHGTG